MFYDVDKTMRAVEEEPSLIFELIKEGHIELVDRLLKKKKVDINTCDDAGNSVLVRLLRHGDYDVVLNHMGNKDWDVNHQNLDGNTFAHYLVSINYVNVMEIIKKLTKNKDFLPNIKNNKGETILDKSINDNYIYTTVKILEDSRFDNIDVVSFKNLYDTYIKSNRYGKYSKINNLEVILDSLTEKDLLPRMKKLVGFIQNNFDKIKEEVLTNQKSVCMDSIINRVLKEDNA
ncbi:MAG TPA: ankyrin repeat domain-containing protein [Candidatus Scybalousia intestinigallinarum]|nr:ankyrin repeat domain-containing protein [Candidatus Scybalousia intestinigallinarum]